MVGRRYSFTDQSTHNKNARVPKTRIRHASSFDPTETNWTPIATAKTPQPTARGRDIYPNVTPHPNRQAASLRNDRSPGSPARNQKWTPAQNMPTIPKKTTDQTGISPPERVPAAITRFTLPALVQRNIKPNATTLLGRMRLSAAPSSPPGIVHVGTDYGRRGRGQ